MNVERIEWVANFVGHTGGEEGEGIESLGLDCLLGRAPAFGNVAQNDRVTDRLGAAVAGVGDCDLRARAMTGLSDPSSNLRVPALDQQRHNVKIQEPVSWIKDFHVAADSALRLGEGFP